jgi:hypothetical protein
MGLFGKVLKLAINTATLPLDAVKDVVTLGGATTDEQSAVCAKLRKLQEEVDELDEDDD